MDSIVSTPSEENKTLLSGIKVKDLIKAIENNKCSNKTSNDVHKTNLNASVLNDINNINNHGETDDDRVIKLKNQLRNTLDKSFSTTSPSDNNASEFDLPEDESESKHEAKFQTYVKRVRSQIFCLPRRRKEHLFHCCLLVALDRCTPYVKSKFPENVRRILNEILTYFHFNFFFCV